MRDHQPLVLDKFNGLFDRGVPEETPLDHFSDCNNIRYIGNNSFGVRWGIARSQDVVSPLSNILRIYNYPTTSANTLLILVAGGSIYHVVDSTTVHGPILTIATMTDFAFASYGGRAYISPFGTETNASGLNIERGLHNEFLYVYKGDGTSAQKAAGAAPTGTLVAGNGAAGHTDAGDHIFGVVFETDTGYLSAPGALVKFTTGAALSVSFSGVPLGASNVTKRHIVASKVIEDYNGDVAGYNLYFIPGATIPNNVGTTLSDISFFDQDLLEDASHLTDNFAEIPAGCGLCMYHNRLVMWGFYSNVNDAYASSPGEPEAVNQIDGLLEVPPNGNPLTNGGELRDILYLFKRSRTVSFVDNGNAPSTWPYSSVDPGMGCGVHGLGTVLDSGSSNIDYFIVGTYKGITLFNGSYIIPELSWKVQARWLAQNFLTRNRIIQILNDPVNSIIYCVLTDNTILYGDYSNGFDSKTIRWSPWSFSVPVNAIALFNIDQLILGCDQATS